MNEEDKDCVRMISDQIFGRTRGGPRNGSQDIGQLGFPARTGAERAAPQAGGWETFRNAQFWAKGGGERGKSG